MIPANAVRLLPPISSCSTATGVADSSAGVAARLPSFTLPVLRFSASAPCTWKKPNASTVRLPDARVTSPSAAAMSSVTLLGFTLVPVGTDRLCAA